MSLPKTLAASDFYVVLERAFRRKTRSCGRCVFSMPFRVGSTAAREANWAVIPSEDCTQRCRDILEDLIADFQRAYRLSDSGRFHVAPGLRG